MSSDALREFAADASDLSIFGGVRGVWGVKAPKPAENRKFSDADPDTLPKETGVSGVSAPPPGAELDTPDTPQTPLGGVSPRCGEIRRNPRLFGR
jgi:hypothetical protein